MPIGSLYISVFFLFFVEDASHVLLCRYRQARSFLLRNNFFSRISHSRTVLLGPFSDPGKVYSRPLPSMIQIIDNIDRWLVYT